MKDQFGCILRRYGRPAAVHVGEEVRMGPAFLQPILDKKRQWLPTPLGQVRQDRFLFLAGSELRPDGLGEDGYVEWDSRRYDVVTAQPVAVGAETVYWWAVLTVREDGETA